ncbi:hypothetical protein [Acinetobacter nosocomialis]|jgi:hypothetical protein|uniref:hypothetical protein n=1 Tax=Acinetobacter nosocomialis TaxID=106654 RepID=UPI003AF9CC4F
MSFFRSLFGKKEIVEPKDPIHNLALKLVAFASNEAEKLALAKQLLCNAKVDFKHEYHYPLGLDTDLKDGINFSMYSKMLLDLYDQLEIEEAEHLEMLNSIDYDPRDYSDKDLDNLDFIEINYVFNNMVSNLKNPREKFAAKLLIIDKVLAS